MATDPSPLASCFVHSHAEWCVAGMASGVLAAFPFLGAGVACSCELTSSSSISSLLLDVAGRGRGGLVTCAGAGVGSGSGHSGAQVICVGTGGAGIVPVVMSCGILMGIVPALPVNFTFRSTLTDLFGSQ